jgi:hypothetical protein
MTKTITGGVVGYEDVVKHDGYADPQYAPARKVRVELRFDGGLKEAEETMEAARKLTNEFLGVAAPAAAAKPATRKKAADAPAAMPAAKTDNGPTVGETHENAVKAVAESSKATAKVLSDKERLAAEQGLVPAQPKTEADELFGAEASEDDALSADEALPPVSDADMNSALTAKNAELKKANPATAAMAPVRIRELGAKYGAPPFSAIPQEKRHAFLAALKELT